jgi:hypothetical protein
MAPSGRSGGRGMVLMRQILLLLSVLMMASCGPKRTIKSAPNGQAVGIEIQSTAPVEVIQALAARLTFETQTPSPTLHLEIQARRFSQLHGKTRWRISGAMEFVGPGPTTPLQFEFPVFLDHPHQGENAALLAAIPHLERRFEKLKSNARATGK